jgi:hypothetical protein
LKYAAAFAALSVGLLYLFITTSSVPAKFLIGSCTLTASGLSVVFAAGRPGLFGKRPDGGIAAWAVLLFWPYLLLNYLMLLLVRRVGREPPYSEIVPGLLLGSRLIPGDQRAFSALGINGVLDLTSELPEIPFLRRSGAYLCIPLLDTFPPSPDQIARGVDWIAAQIQSGPVYVHCALGHGRSATFVAGYAVRTGHALSPEEALRLVRERRPAIGLHERQISALSAYCRSLEDSNSGTAPLPPSRS